jgi:DNA (cytosine-5)-methyltransferase 1
MGHGAWHRCDAGGTEQSLQGAGEHGEAWPDTPDIITGGFPCQPVSHAGKRQGAADDRYLWPEMFRLVRTLRPRWVVAENVYGLITHEDGALLDKVYDDLEGEGYEALPPIVLPACALGAPHRRDRVWIVAHDPVAGQPRSWRHGEQERPPDDAERGGEAVADTAGGRLKEQRDDGKAAGETRPESLSADSWAVESDVGRVAHGIPRRVDRLRGLGNAIVPQIAELIGRLIVAEESRSQI